MVESTTLLTWQGLTALEGSNPSLSAHTSKKALKGFFVLMCERRERDLKDGGPRLRASEQLKRVGRVRAGAT